MQQSGSLDLVAGGLFFQAGAILAWSVSNLLPLWWFTTTELEGEMCSCGTGLWTGNWTWGDDITQPNVLGGPILCNSDNDYVTQGCDASFEFQAESRTKGFVGGAFSIMSIILSLCGWFMALANFVAKQGVEVAQFRRRLVYAAVSTLVAIASQIVTIGVFMSSPLFDNLGETFGCKFVFNHALNSNALKCHALGPAFGLAVGGCLLSAMSYTMFFLAFKNPHYIDAGTGRYSMFQEKLLGARPLDYYEAVPLNERGILARGESSIRELNGEPPNTSIAHNGGSRVGPEPSDDDDQYSRLEDQQQQQQSQNLQNKIVPGLACNFGTRAGIAQFFRLYTMPTLLLLNIAFFTWSNCSTGATVEPNVKISLPKGLHALAHWALPGQVDKHGVIAFKDDVFNFTLVSSLQHFWQGKAYGLAVLIGLFSGIWPYVKLFTMLFLWFVPATESLRGKMLHWLDVLGKWSLVDAYVLCLMAVAFGFNADKDILGIGIHVDMSVRPGWGVYSFVLGTMWSLLMSHHLTDLHRNAMERRELSDKVRMAMEMPPHETLATRNYAPFARRRRFACSIVGQIAVWVVFVLTVGVTLTGQLISTFEFRFSGLAELILPPDGKNTEYSLVSNGALLPEACSKGGFLSGGLFWSWFMTIMYFLFAMIIPLSMVVALAVLWGVPMTLASTKRCFRFCQFVQSWAALDVFLVSIIAAVMEIGQLSEAILGDSFGAEQDMVCNLLKNPLVDWFTTHVIGIPSYKDECALFRVDAVLMEGCWMLLAGVCSWAFCTHLVMEFADASIQERTMIIKVLCGTTSGNKTDDSDPDPYELLRIHHSETQDSIDSGNSTDAQSNGGGNAAHGGNGDENDGNQGADMARALLGVDGRNSRSNSVVSTYDASLDVGTFSTLQNDYLKRILQAQEDGGKRFIGTYFGSFMYGPLPRRWWRTFEYIGVLRKVPWDRVGFEMHAALLLVTLSDQEERVRVRRAQSSSSQGSQATNEGAAITAVVHGASWEPLSPLHT